MANFPIQKYTIVCNECTGQEFQFKEEAIKHVSETHDTITPHLVEDYIKVDVNYIAFVNNKVLGKKKFNWIKFPKKSPSCNGCDRVFESWIDAGAHAFASHKVGTDYGLCQMIGKDVLTKIPEIRKKLFICNYCPKPKVFRFKHSLKHHFIAQHGLEEKDASILVKIGRK